MAEIPKLTFHSSVSFPSEIGLEESCFDGSLLLKMAVPDQEVLGNRTERSSSVALDIESLSQFTDKELTSNARSTRSLSRKGSHRGERKTTDGGETDETPKQASIGSTPNCTPKSIILPLTTELCNSQAARRYGKRSSWIDPRRILYIFATISSMGTMILIYFTLAIGKISGDDTDAQR